MNWILHSDIRPGQPVNVTQLSRQFGVSATVIRGYLQRLRHYGLLEARPNSTWIFRGITSAFATELCEIREIFEPIRAPRCHAGARRAGLGGTAANPCRASRAAAGYRGTLPGFLSAGRTAAPADL
ncbi:GntR family transcriptional regulator [Pseudoroseomonas wenyumeiae]